MAGEGRGKKKKREEGSSGLVSQQEVQLASTDDSCLLPESTVSTMTVEELRSIRSRYGIPDGFQLLIPDSESRVDNPPEGCVAVYEEYLRAGLRFPIDDFLRNLLNFYNLSLGQLVPNSIRIAIGFALVCDLANVRPRMGLFRPKFVLRRHSQSKGWWMFASREGRFLPDLPSSIHGWKDKFFYVSHSASSSSAPSWGFPSVWVEPKTSSNREKGISSLDKEDYNLLEDMEVPAVRDLITDQSLYDAGIGPAPRENMMSPDEVNRMFPKRPATRKEPSEAPQKKKRRKKQLTRGPANHPPVTHPARTSTPPRRPSPEYISDDEPTEDSAAGTESIPGGVPDVPTMAPPSEAGPSRRVNPDPVHISMGDSGVTDPALARRLMNLLITPHDEDDWRNRPIGDILNQSYTGLISSANNLLVLDRRIQASQELARTWAERVTAAEADRIVAQELLQAAEDRERSHLNEISQLKAEKARLEADRSEIFQLRADKARLEADRARMAQESENNMIQLQEALSNLESTRVSLGQSESAMGQAQAESFINRLEADAANERARAALKEKEMAEELAKESVKIYKTSAEHKADMIAYSRLFFTTGFNRCKTEIAAVFPDLDFSGIEDPVFNDPAEDNPDSEMEESSEEEEESSAEGTRGEPTASLAGTAPVGDVPVTEIVSSPEATGSVQAAIEAQPVTILPAEDPDDEPVERELDRID